MTGSIHHRPAALAGVGLRAPHVAQVIDERPPVAWFEVHAENYMGRGPAFEALARVRRDYPVALHGVGLSLGSAEDIDRDHLNRLKDLADRIDPRFVSEHVSWSRIGGVCLNDLLPLPYTEEALDLLCRHVDQTQEVLGRRLLMENPSAYLRWADSAIPEPEFLGALARRTGCGLLCDVNNVHVGACNTGFDAVAWLDALPAAAVGEIHLAGHHAAEADGATVLIDDHGSRVDPAVWRLFGHALWRFGPVPTLIEWDTRIPPLETLMAEAALAERRIAVARWRTAHADAA